MRPGHFLQLVSSEMGRQSSRSCNPSHSQASLARGSQGKHRPSAQPVVSTASRTSSGLLGTAPRWPPGLALRTAQNNLLPESLRRLSSLRGIKCILSHTPSGDWLCPFCLTLSCPGLSYTAVLCTDAELARPTQALQLCDMALLCSRRVPESCPQRESICSHRNMRQHTASVGAIEFASLGPSTTG